MDLKDLSRSKAEIEKAKYRKVPKDIKKIRQQRERERMLKGYAWFLIYIAVFAAGVASQNEWLINLSFIASAITNIYVYSAHEKLLRRLADRPQADYPAIAKMEKRLRIGKELPGGKAR
jgi:hypothetical protein